MSPFSAPRRGAVRKNVTLDASVADAVERVAELSGMSQGDVVAMALGSWRMRMLTAFATGLSPVADALDVYLANHVRVEETAVVAFCEMFRSMLDGTSFFGDSGVGGDEGLAVAASGRAAANAYVAGHLRGCGFTTCRDLAVAGKFVVEDDAVTRAHVERLLNAYRVVASLDGFVDEYEMRVIVALFRDFVFVQGATREEQYASFAVRADVFGLRL